MKGGINTSLDTSPCSLSLESIHLPCKPVAFQFFSSVFRQVHIVTALLNHKLIVFLILDKIIIMQD